MWKQYKREKEISNSLASIIDRQLIYVPGYDGSGIRQWWSTENIGCDDRVARVHNYAPQKNPKRLSAAKRVAASLRAGRPVLCVVQNREVSINEHVLGYAEALLETLIQSPYAPDEPHYIMVISHSLAIPENIDYLRSIGIIIWYVDHCDDEDDSIEYALRGKVRRINSNSIYWGWNVEAPRPLFHRIAYVARRCSALTYEGEVILIESGCPILSDTARDNAVYTTLRKLGGDLSFGAMDYAKLDKYRFFCDCESEIRNVLMHVWNTYSDDDEFLAEVQADMRDVREAYIEIKNLLKIYRAVMSAAVASTPTTGGEVVVHKRRGLRRWFRELVEKYRIITHEETDADFNAYRITGDSLTLFEENGGREAVTTYFEGIPVVDIVGQYGGNAMTER